MKHFLPLLLPFIWFLNSAAIVPLDHTQNCYYVAHLVSQADPTNVANTLGLQYQGQLGELEGHFIFSAPGPCRNTENHDILSVFNRRPLNSTLLKRDNIPPTESISFWEPQVHRKRLSKRILQADLNKPAPLDKVSEVSKAFNISDPLFSRQWHLVNNLQIGHDLNVSNVWSQGNFGEGVNVAIVDDGIDHEGKDLAENYFAEGSYDFNNYQPDPRPQLFDDYHGTRCAGEIAAVRNDMCGVGVAYKAGVAGIRILGGEVSDADEASALNYQFHQNHIYSCSWGPTDDGVQMEGPGELIQRAFLNGVQRGRNKLGSVFVFASGNGGGNGDNCNFDGYTNSIFSITVGAVDRLDNHPPYAELCSAQLIVGYSSGSGDYIHTTDINNKCYDKHSGTSAAAPLAAGVFALVLSERPDLTWRDMQHLCVHSAQPVDEKDPDWVKTAGGFKFNHKYGFGKLDAYHIVELAKTFKSVKPQAWYESGKVNADAEIPMDHSYTESVFLVDLDSLKNENFERLEHVTVTVNIEHPRRGDVIIDLVSPHGTVSNLATSRIHDGSTQGFQNWTLMSVKHW